MPITDFGRNTSATEVLVFLPKSPATERLCLPENDFISLLHLITFGGGPHLCMGVNVATIEARMLAARVVRSYYLETISEHAAEQFGFTDERWAPVSYGS